MPEPTPLARQIAALNQLHSGTDPAELRQKLRDALEDRSQRVIAKAAEMCGQLRVPELSEALEAAYERAFLNPLKRDPGCLIKQAVTESLLDLELDRVDLYRQGVTYRQLEPVWGGQEDTAAVLRATSAAGMAVYASRLEAVNCCADLLADPCKPARLGAARALAGLGSWEGVPLLRLKIRLGDEDAEVIGECCSALLELDSAEGLPLVLELLHSRDADLRIRAALALGESRQNEAFSALCNCWKAERELSIRGLLLAAIGLLRSRESREFLVAVVGDKDGAAAADAVRALAPFAPIEELRAAVAAQVETTGNPRLKAVFDEEFGRAPLEDE